MRSTWRLFVVVGVAEGGALVVVAATAARQSRAENRLNITVRFLAICQILVSKMFLVTVLKKSS